MPQFTLPGSLQGPFSALRRHQRILVPPERRIHAVGTDGVSNAVQGLVTVIGLGGMFVRTQSQVHPDATLRLTTTDVLLSFESDCIVRSVAAHGVGLEFGPMSTSDENRLCDLLRNLKGCPPSEPT